MSDVKISQELAEEIATRAENSSFLNATIAKELRIAIDLCKVDNRQMCLLQFTKAHPLAPAEPSLGSCCPEVFEKGVSVCLLDIPKEAAENICTAMSAVTGFKIDWHYIGGKVHVKALPTAVSVVLPQYLDTQQMDGYQSPYDKGWNDSRADSAKLNGVKL